MEVMGGGVAAGKEHSRRYLLLRVTRGRAQPVAQGSIRKGDRKGMEDKRKKEKHGSGRTTSCRDLHHPEGPPDAPHHHRSD